MNRIAAPAKSLRSLPVGWSWIWLAVLSVALASARPAHGQSASLTGRVIDQSSRAGVADAVVRLAALDLSARTDGSGAFTIRALPAGRHVLQVVATGYESRSDSIDVAEDQAVSVVITLSPDPVPLEPVSVEARVGARTAWLGSRGFFQRESDASLLHMTQEELVHRNVRNLRDVLRRTEGVRIRRLVDGGGELLLEPSPLPNGERCVVSIFLNGSEVDFGTFVWTGVNYNQRALRPLRFDDLLILEEVDAIELYGPDHMPVATDACGALLLWSSRIRSQTDEPFIGSLEGTAIHEATGRAIRGVRITLTPSGLNAVTDENGRFSFDGLVPGEYQVTATAPGASPWTGTVRVRAYGSAIVELRM